MNYAYRLGGVLAVITAVFICSIVLIGPHFGTTPAHAASSPTNCFAHPGSCGYPDPTTGNVGATAACSSLTPSGSITASTNNQTIQNLNITGTIDITAANVTVNNVCVTADGGAEGGSEAISIYGNASNVTLQHVTIGGANSTNRSVQVAVFNHNGAATTIRYGYVHNCGECLQYGPFTVSDSYIISDGMQPVDVTEEHYEDVYMSDGTISVDHSVLLNPEPQTATIFADTDIGFGGPCANHITLNNSLVAGGGYVIYPCSASSSAGTSSIHITNNRIARCITTPIKYNSGSGGSACQNSTGQYPSDGPAGADQYGYWPYGGYFGMIGGPRGNLTWSGNAWDDNCRAVDADGVSGATNSCYGMGSGVTGDVNADGVINGADISLVVADFNKAAGSATTPTADLNSDGVINGADLSTVITNFGH